MQIAFIYFLYKAAHPVSFRKPFTKSCLYWMDKQHQRIRTDSQRHLDGVLFPLPLAHMGEVCVSSRCQREPLQRGECPGLHRAGTMQQCWASPRAACGCILQAERDASLHARQTQSSCYPPGSDQGTTTPFATLTKAPLFPSSPCPESERNTTSTQECSDYCIYI